VKNQAGMANFIKELKAKIKIAVNAKVGQKNSIVGHSIMQHGVMDMKKIIAMGASTGGTEALYSVLKQLPSQMPGIVIVQHIPPVFSGMCAERLNRQTQLRFKEACDGDIVEPGKVLIAPGDYQIRLRKVGNTYKVDVFNGDKVNGHCPSVDVLFESVATQAGKNAVGVILTGMGSDGARGLLAMRRMGARTIGQDEHSAVVYGMPKVAFNIGAVEKQVPLDQIPQLIYSMIKG
jgi:two-component system chemotaxis response regulator CheB